MTDHDLHEARARRYAKALADAAAAQERIDALTEQLAEHEWHRSEAESQLALFETSEHLGRVFLHGDDAPDVDALLDISNGQIWRRSNYNGTWVKADQSERGATHYDWPISDAGPLIAIEDTWVIERQAERLRAYNETEDALHRAMGGMKGYRDEGDSSWQRPSLVAAFNRIFLEQNRVRSELLGELGEVKRRKDELEFQVGALREQLAKQAEGVAR